MSALTYSYYLSKVSKRRYIKKILHFSIFFSGLRLNPIMNDMEVPHPLRFIMPYLAVRYLITSYNLKVKYCVQIIDHYSMKICITFMALKVESIFDISFVEPQASLASYMYVFKKMGK